MPFLCVRWKELALGPGEGPFRGGEVDAALVERTPDDCAFDARSADCRQVVFSSDPSRGDDGRTLVVTIRRFKAAWQAIQRILLQHLQSCRNRPAT